MGKGGKQRRRRQPVRQPIPTARLKAGQTAARRSGFTERDLVDGWPLGPELRIRQARSEDMGAVAALSALTGVQLEPEVTDAVATGIAAEGLRAFARGGKDGLMRHMAEQFFAHQGGDTAVPFQHVTLVLVAEHAEQGVVGALVAYPPVGVIQQMLDHLRRTGGGPNQATQVVLMGAIAMARIKALAVLEQMRGRGIGSALLQRALQIYDECGYMIVYGQAPGTTGLDLFYQEQDFDVLAPGTGFDPWVVFGEHVDIRPDPTERIFIWNRPPDGQSRRRSAQARRVPRQGRFDPGTLALHDAYLPWLLEHGDGEKLAIHFPALLWVKLAEGVHGNACVDACATLRYAYEQLGIPAELLPAGVMIHEESGRRTEYATDEPHWVNGTIFVGHTVLVLPEHGKLVDPTVEQVPAIRKLGMGPIIGRIPPEGRQALREGGVSFVVPREKLLIEYAPARSGHRDVLVDAPLLVEHADRYRRAGINLATMVLEMFRSPQVLPRIRQAPFPVIHALLDAIGDVPLEPDDDGNMRVLLPDGAGGTRPVYLDELPPSDPSTSPTASTNRSWWGRRRRT